MLTSQQVPQRIQLLLGMRHTGDLLLGVVDGLSDISSELLKDFRETVLFWSRLSGGSLVLGVGLDASIGIKTTDDTICFGQDHTALLDQWLDGIDQFLLVEFFLWLALGCFDGLHVC